VKIRQHFLNFWISQVQQQIADEMEIFVMYTDNFLTNQSVKEFWNLVHDLPKLLSNIKGLTFFGTQCIVTNMYQLYLVYKWRDFRPIIMS